MTALNLPGGSGNYASSPDHASLDVTGNIDIRARIAPTDWTPSADRCIVSKSNTTGNQRSYQLILQTPGNLRFTWSTDGTSAGATNADSTVATGFTDGTPHWVRVTLATATGTITFYTSEDGSHWTQLGAQVVTAATSIFASTATANIGARSAGTADVFVGRIFSAQIRNGIDGTIVADPRFDQQAPGDNAFDDSTGKTWTVNGTAAITSGVDFTAVEQDAYPPRVLLTLTGLAVTGTPDAAELYRVVGGERTSVRGGSLEAATDPSFLRVDAELPFGVPITWLAVVNGEDEYTVGPITYTLPGGKVALSDAIAGTAAEVVILAWPEKDYNPQRSEFKVGGRNVVVSGDFGMFTGTIEFFLENTSSLDNLMSILATLTGNVAQLRQAGGYDDIDCYIAILGATKRRFSQDGSDQRRIVVLRVSETESWAPALEARGFTYQDLADAYDGLTYADLAGDYSTYLALAQADLS